MGRDISKVCSPTPCWNMLFQKRLTADAKIYFFLIKKKGKKSNPILRLPDASLYKQSKTNLCNAAISLANRAKKFHVLEHYTLS